MTKYLFSFFTILFVLFLTFIIIVLMQLTNPLYPQFDGELSFNNSYNYIITTNKDNLDNPNEYIEKFLEENDMKNLSTDTYDYELIYMDEGLYSIMSSEKVYLNYFVPLEKKDIGFKPEQSKEDYYYEDHNKLLSYTLYFNIPVTDGLIIDSYNFNFSLKYIKQDSYVPLNKTPNQNGYFITKPQETLPDFYYYESYAYDSDNQVVKPISIDEDVEITYPLDIELIYDEENDIFTNNSDYTLITLYN